VYDAIVIGARCAGATTAMLLAREGFRVLLLDRARFPSEIPHGHFIHRHGPARLSRWGLLEPILETGCPPVTSIAMDLGDFPLVGRDLVVDGVPVGLGPRRAALDKVLVDAAVAAGAELREGFAVDDLTFEDDRVTGIRGRARNGSPPVAETARFVIGADGRNSSVAKRVEALAYEAVQTVTCWYFSYWSGMPSEGLELYRLDRRVIFAFPTNDGLFALFVAWPIEELTAVRADVERELLAVVDSVPELAERVRGGSREERIYGATQLPNFLRTPGGPGWALVGDAGCHKDPYLALGLCDALRDAELLSEALADALTGRRPEHEALADYERVRNEATMPDYQQNISLARFNPLPPEILERRAAARGNQEAANRFYLVGEGRISP
jgi:flavin-dependent dehydrogenase